MPIKSYGGNTFGGRLNPPPPGNRRVKKIQKHSKDTWGQIFVENQILHTFLITKLINAIFDTGNCKTFDVMC